MYARHRFPAALISYAVWLDFANNFACSFELIRQHFHPKQHRLFANEYRREMRQRFKTWRELTSTQIAV